MRWWFAATAVITCILGLQVGAAHSQSLHQNLHACQRGYSSCDTSLLTEPQQQQVYQLQLGTNDTAALQFNIPRNIKPCGIDSSNCRSLPQLRPVNPAHIGQCAENGSCYGDISKLTGRPKTVHVRGYYRKDGTYVRSHYRSKKR
jgi:hypothetical protein